MLTNEERNRVLLEVWHNGRDPWEKPEFYKLSRLSDEVFKKGHILDIRSEDAFLHSCRDADVIDLHYTYFKVL